MELLSAVWPEEFDGRETWDSNEQPVIAAQVTPRDPRDIKRHQDTMMVYAPVLDT